MVSHAHSAIDGDGQKIIAPAQTVKIWRMFWFLLAVTVSEFVIAFMMPHGSAKIMIFVLLTFVKAAGIIGEFMHLRYEAKTLIWTIIIPVVFVIWLIAALIIEGGYIGLER